MNCVHIIGLMGKDKKLNTTPTQKQVCSFTLGVQSQRKDKETGKKIMDWFSCEAWGSISERVYYSYNFRDMMAIQGHLYVKKYKWKDTTYEKNIIVVDDVTFVDPAKNYKNYEINVHAEQANVDNTAANELDGYTIDNSNGNSDLEGIDW